MNQSRVAPRRYPAITGKGKRENRILTLDDSPDSITAYEFVRSQGTACAIVDVAGYDLSDFQVPRLQFGRTEFVGLEDIRRFVRTWTALLPSDLSAA